MKFLPSLLTVALGAAVIFPASAASGNERIATVQDVRSTLTEALGFRYAIDSDGDIQLDFNDAPTVWISFINGGKKLKADSNDEVAVIRVFSHVATADPSSYNDYVKASNTFNRKYVQKSYVSVDSEHCVFVMEHYEFVSDSYNADQFVLGVVSFVKQVSNVKAGKTDIQL